MPWKKFASLDENAPIGVAGQKRSRARQGLGLRNRGSPVVGATGAVQDRSECGEPLHEVGDCSNYAPLACSKPVVLFCTLSSLSSMTIMSPSKSPFHKHTTPLNQSVQTWAASQSSLRRGLNKAPPILRALQRLQ